MCLKSIYFSSAKRFMVFIHSLSLRFSAQRYHLPAYFFCLPRSGDTCYCVLLVNVSVVAKGRTSGGGGRWRAGGGSRQRGKRPFPSLVTCEHARRAGEPVGNGRLPTAFDGQRRFSDRKVPFARLSIPLNSVLLRSAYRAIAENRLVVRNTVLVSVKISEYL